MNSREAISALLRLGYTAKPGKGRHVIFRKDNDFVLISNGKSELSTAMTRKVRTALRKGSVEPRK